MSKSSKPVVVNPLKRVVRGYVRVSTMEQAREGVSLETQEERINAWAQYKGYHVGEIVKDEGISGRTLEARPQLIHLIDKIRRKELLVVISLSRLARNSQDAADINRHINRKGASLVILDLDINTDTAVGRLIFTVIAAIAQMESDQTSERVTDNMMNLRAQNKLITKPKYGYFSPGKGLQPQEHVGQKEVIEIMRQYKANNPRWGWSLICKKLNDDHVPTHTRAKRWYPSRVRLIMIDNGIVDDDGIYITSSEGESESSGDEKEED